jgi:hypothetical protein
VFQVSGCYNIIIFIQQKQHILLILVNGICISSLEELPVQTGSNSIHDLNTWLKAVRSSAYSYEGAVQIVLASRPNLEDTIN